MKLTRIEQIQSLRNKRYTYQQIGNLFGISRQRIYQILHPFDIPFSILKNKKEIKKVIISKNITITKLTKMKYGSRDRIRKLVRIRDNYTCQICGKVWQKGQRRLDIHHLDCDNNKTKQNDKFYDNGTWSILCH